MALTLYSIHYSLHRALVRSVAQDETEFMGHSSKPEKLVARYIAPSEEVAVAHFTEEYSHIISDPAYKFSQGRIEEMRVDAVIEVRTRD